VVAPKLTQMDSAQLPESLRDLVNRAARLGNPADNMVRKAAGRVRGLSQPELKRQLRLPLAPQTKLVAASRIVPWLPGRAVEYLPEILRELPQGKDEVLLAAVYRMVGEGASADRILRLATHKDRILPHIRRAQLWHGTWEAASGELRPEFRDALYQIARSGPEAGRVARQWLASQPSLTLAELRTAVSLLEIAQGRDIALENLGKVGPATLAEAQALADDFGRWESSSVLYLALDILRPEALREVATSRRFPREFRLKAKWLLEGGGGRPLHARLGNMMRLRPPDHLSPEMLARILTRARDPWAQSRELARQLPYLAPLTAEEARALEEKVHPWNRRLFERGIAGKIKD
jgi:hypothetical protein